MAADKVVVVACTWLILASLGAATAISYTAERENENVAHWLTVRTFATETSSVHLTRCCRSCVLARNYFQYLRMDVAIFEELYALVEPEIVRKC